MQVQSYVLELYWTSIGVVLDLLWRCYEESIELNFFITEI